MLKIENITGFALLERFQRSFAVRLGSQVNFASQQLLVDKANDRLPIDTGKTIAQCSLALIDTVHRPLKGCAIQRPVNAQRERHIVCGARIFHLVHEPEAFLRRR
ncbi:hypothetical protein IBA8403_04930 [Pseudomonas syringae]